MPRRQRKYKFLGPPEGQPWAWVTLELLQSEAWRARSINCIRLIDFLICEHGHHRGLENGNLMATYDQLQKFGLSRDLIRAAVDEAKSLGLIRVVRGGRWAQTNQPSKYTLTFYGKADGSPPTNDWKGVNVETALLSQRDARERQAAKERRKRNLKNQSGVRFVELP